MLFLDSVLEIRRELASHWTQIVALFVGELQSITRGTVIGSAWNIIIPITPVCLYLLLSSLRAIPNFNDVNSAVYLTFGVTLWFLFVGCIKIPIDVIDNKLALSRQTKIPLLGIIIAKFAHVLYEFFIRLILVTLVIYITESTLHWTVIFLPFFVLIAVMLFTAVGIILGIMNKIWPDVRKVSDIVLQYGIFVSGVIFPITIYESLHLLSLINPLAFFIELCRSLAFKGEFFRLSLASVYVLTGILIFIYATRILRSTSSRLKEFI